MKYVVIVVLHMTEAANSRPGTLDHAVAMGGEGRWLLLRQQLS